MLLNRAIFNGIVATPTRAPPPIPAPRPARHIWDPARLRARNAVLVDDRPGAPPENVFWAGNLGEAGHLLYGMESLWLPRSLQLGRRAQLVDALIAATRHWSVELHFQKALAGAPADALAATRDTATNPALLDAFTLMIIGAGQQPAYPGLSGHEPDMETARRQAQAVVKAADELRKVAPDAGTYAPRAAFSNATGSAPIGVLTTRSSSR